MELLIPGNGRVDAGAEARHRNGASRFAAHPSYEDDEWIPERPQPKRANGLASILPVLGLIAGLLVTYTVICST
jgi:hypothetical protein